MSEIGTMATLFSLTGSEIISDQRLKQAKLRHERGVNEGISLEEQFVHQNATVSSTESCA